jgi:hypothetical protein
MSAGPFDDRVAERLHLLVDDAYPSAMMRTRAEQRAASVRRRRLFSVRATLLISGAVAALALAIVGASVLGHRSDHGTRVAAAPPTTPLHPSGTGPTVPPDAQGSSAITGVVTVGGRPLKGANVRVAIEPCCLYREAFTGEDGSYSITGLPAGKYAVSFGKGARLSWYHDMQTFGDADLVVLSGGEHRSGINGVLLAGSSISGRVTSLAGAPIGGVWVYFDGPRYGKVETDAAGTYAISDLPPGDYTVRFDPGPAKLPYIGEYYNNKPETSKADRIHLEDGSQRTGVDAALAGD